MRSTGAKSAVTSAAAHGATGNIRANIAIVSFALFPRQRGWLCSPLLANALVKCAATKSRFSARLALPVLDPVGGRGECTVPSGKGNVRTSGFYRNLRRRRDFFRFGMFRVDAHEVTTGFSGERRKDRTTSTIMFHTGRAPCGRDVQNVKREGEVKNGLARRARKSAMRRLAFAAW